eukprot:Skav236288  [mRNA]  locus=scaffold2529:153022:154044:+ [translate_table: standard]
MQCAAKRRRLTTFKQERQGDAVPQGGNSSASTRGCLVFHVLSGTWRKSSSGAMQSQDVAPKPAPVDAPEGGAAVGSRDAPAEWPKPSRFQRYNLVKQSGIPRITWNRGHHGWDVRLPKFDSEGRKIGKTNRVFAVKSFIAPGRSEAEADAAALEAAKAFHAELVKQGVLKELKPQDPDFTSEVPGVSWSKRERKWRVQITEKGKRRRFLQGGSFSEKSSAEAKAMELRKDHGLQRQLRRASTVVGESSYLRLPVFHPEVPYDGVTWDRRSKHWHAQCRVGGASRHFYVKPKDHSEAELERSLEAAFAWKKEEEKDEKEEKEEKEEREEREERKERKKREE